MKRKIIWEWVLPKLYALAAVALVEIGHHILPWGLLALMCGWGMLGTAYSVLWRRWRSSEIDRIHRSCPSRGRLPRVSLVTGEDFSTGQVAIVNDRGFVVRPRRPFPPPAKLSWVAGLTGNDQDYEINLDGLNEPGP